MTRLVIDIDDALLAAAGAELGTASDEDTVLGALRLAANDNQSMSATLAALADAPNDDRMETWH